MQITVIGSPGSWYLRDLVRAAAGRHDITAATFQGVSSSISTGPFTATSAKCDLTSADCILVRTMPAGSLEQVVFRMDVLSRLESSGIRVVNSARAIETAVDKYLATAKLAAAGLLVPRTTACQTVDQAMAAFESLGGDVVLKPLFGAEGRGITRISDEAVAYHTAKALCLLGSVLYIQPFIEHEGGDMRLLVIGQKVLGIRRQNRHDWRTNISRGATAEPLEVTGPLAELAQRAARAVGAPLAGVDLLPGRDGHLYTLEVNAVPGWRALSGALQVDVARLVLDYLESEG